MLLNKPATVPVVQQRAVRAAVHRCTPSTTGARRTTARALPPGPEKDGTSVGRRALLGVAPLCCACPSCSGGQRKRLDWYDRYFAGAMHSSMGTYEAAIAPLKERIFGDLAAEAGRGRGDGAPLKLLEVGIGTGPNFGYLARALGDRTASLQLTGLDPNPAMQPYAREAAAAAGLREGQVTLVEGDAQAMPFEDGAFDAAVITLVLCSVPDPIAALSEVRRVVAPGGRLALIEHVAAPPSRPLISLVQHALDPLQQLVADGCHLTRDTGAALVKAGLDGPRVQRLDVEGLGFFAPHLAGIVEL